MVEKEKKRNTLLNVWLIIMLIANVFSAISYLFFNSLLSSAYPYAPSWIFHIYGLLSLINIILVSFLFKWKRWAFYVFCIVTLLALIMNIYIGIEIIASMLGIVGPIILYLIMKPKWNLFE